MSAAPTEWLSTAGDVVRRFGLAALWPALRACEALAVEGAPLDVAVLGQFKSGKSSLLNALLGDAVFPVGAVPVTAVVTRAAAGPKGLIRVTYLSNSVEEVAPARLADFVTEAGNPGNQKQVAVVDVFTPALAGLPGVRLVDTPGLGSVLAHNTEATRAWMPNVAVALVTVSAERPLAEEDRRLVEEARQTAPRVVVLLTKVDLLTAEDLAEVTRFLERALGEHFGAGLHVLPFSSRVDPERWSRELREAVLLPVANDVAGRRREALGLKLSALTDACRGYLEVGLRSAERAEADRDRLRAAVLTESVNAAVIRDELLLAEQRMVDGIRPALEKALLAQREAVGRRLTAALASEMTTWRGNLARQAERYQRWMAEHLTEELAPLSRGAAPLAAALVGQAEARFRRVVEAFRDRLGRNIREATGVTVSSVSWEAKPPQVAVVPVAVSRAFMTDWGMFWWLLPMWVVGWLFQRHVLGRVLWEVEKNLARLVSDWAGAVGAGVADLCGQADAWVSAELATLDRLLGHRPDEAASFREALRRLDELRKAQPAGPGQGRPGGPP